MFFQVQKPHTDVRCRLREYKQYQATGIGLKATSVLGCNTIMCDQAVGISAALRYRFSSLALILLFFEVIGLASLQACGVAGIDREDFL